jgi:D-alanyl-lipoteichoic acid acyltransferase DltB (MBOAT superfamily)
MWVLYGGALLSAIRFSYRLAVRGVTESLQYFAMIVIALQLTIIGLCLTGPVFNTQLGILFWTVTAALFGAADSWQAEDELAIQSGNDVGWADAGGPVA